MEREITGNYSRDLFPVGVQAFYDDPYSYYRELRENYPFYRTADGAWVISRYADIEFALDHPNLGNRPSRFSTLHESKRERFVCANVASHIMPFLDGVAHKEQRRLIARILQAEVKAYAPRLDELAGHAVEKLPGKFNVIEDFAHPFAVDVICGLLGIPHEPRLREWSSSFFYLFTKIPSAEVRDQVDQHLREFREWTTVLMRAQSPEGVIGGLAEAVSNGGLSEKVAVDSLILLFADGLENVDSGIGNAVYTFSRFPTEWEKLRAEESLLDSAVDECLRFESPAQYIARTCLDDFEWEGHQFKKDNSVILLLASANRDEAKFHDAGRFDISRSPNPHLSFGRGKHSCLGGNLVELELAAILGALRRRFARFEQAGEIRWQTRTGHRWMEEASFGTV